MEKIEEHFDFLRLLKDVAIELGATFAIIINPNDLIFDPKSRFKCLSCKRYGTKATCPPNIPDIEYYQNLIMHYRFGLLIGIKRDALRGKEKEVGQQSGLDLHKILLELERQAFERGYVFAISFIGGSCKLCGTDKCESPCKNPTKGRNPLEGIGVNVIETCKKYGIEIKFPVVPDGKFWRVGLLLVV